MRCSLEAAKHLWVVMCVVCTAYIYTGAIFFYVFPKFKRGMPAVTSMTTPLRVVLRIYRAVIFVLAINSSKMKQMVVYLFCGSRAIAS